MKDFTTLVLSIGTPITIFEHTFNDLSDIRDHVEVMSSIGHKDAGGIWDKPYISSLSPEKNVQGIHVLEIYERYPCFDSSDYAYEDRFFRNFFFSIEPFSQKEVSHLALLKYSGNCEIIPEDIPDKYVHIYYAGEGDYMKVTSSKSQL